MNAIILAGGRGSRLEPWHAPKCLMPINGVPMLERILNGLDFRHDDHVAIATGYRANDIESYLDFHGRTSCIRTSFAGEDVPMGTRLIKARGLVEDARVLVCYGDELADVDIAALVKKHEGEQNAITFVAAYQKITGGMVFHKEKPVAIVEGQKVLVNIGFVVVEPQCWELLKPEDGLSDWINRISAHGLPVGVYPHEGKRATVNSLADLKYAEEIWK